MELMVYDIDEMSKELEKFKINALLRIQALEVKLEASDEDKEEVKEEVKELKKTVVEDINRLNEKFELFKDEMPNKTTYKIIVTIFGATISFIFAIIILFLEGKI
jgi:CRISPR/Cas system-associated endoribonuclease Cas2